MRESAQASKSETSAVPQFQVELGGGGGEVILVKPPSTCIFSPQNPIVCIKQNDGAQMDKIPIGEPTMWAELAALLSTVILRHCSGQFCLYSFNTTGIWPYFCIVHSLNKMLITLLEEILSHACLKQSLVIIP